MADSHPKNLDPRPKRRRDEENPYEIYTAGINKFSIAFSIDLLTGEIVHPSISAICSYVNSPK